MELAEGLILDGHYRLRQMLGRGGMGEVWEAEHTRLPKMFAIKFLLSLTKTEPELLMRFKREAEIASRLNHPSIVQVTDFNILADGTAYIAMERLVGEDLRARLGQGPLTLSETREITKQVASALQLAHQEGIVHRDLKPENIFLCREPDGSLRAKVLDFGISKLQGAAGSGTRDDHVLGTPGYMAPEQAMRKNSTIDGRTDLFALATIVYEMLTGEGAFMGDTLAELCTKVLFHEPAPLAQLLPAVPRPISNAVSTALSKDPGARQSSIRQFAEQIVGADVPTRPMTGFAATFASDAHAPVPRPASVPPIDATDVATRSEFPQPATPSTPARKRRTRTALAALCILALVGIGAWWQLRPQPEAQTAPVAQVAPPEPPAVVVAPPPQQEPAAATKEPAPTVPDEQRSFSRVQKLDPGALSKREKKSNLSAEARATLQDAERALDSGDSGNALRLARSSMRDGPSEEAYYVMARAYCGQRDVGMVQAMMRNLSSGLGKQVRASCQKQGLAVP